MNKLKENLINIWEIEELRKRVLLTLGLILVYRIGSVISLPGVDTVELNRFIEGGSGNNDLINLINAFTGGAFSQVSIFALGIMPYISASIVIQLMGIIVPYIQKLQKEGESGRNKVNNITRWLTIGICLVQGPAYITFTKSSMPPEVFLMGDTMFYIVSTIILITGTIFAMWIGEKITDKGIGNGISILILVGIIAGLPGALFQEFTENDPIMFIVEIVIWLLVLAFSVAITLAVRKIPLQYARKAVMGSGSKYMKGQVAGGGNREFLPLKLIAAGVMPIIFAQVIMFVPITALGAFENDTIKEFAIKFQDPYGFPYNLTFALLIIVFTFLYTAITVKTNEMADDLKRSGSFIPGIKPGLDTAEYVDTILSRITIWGALFLALVSVVPAFAYLLGVRSFAQFFGGTSLLILVSVVIDTVQQIDAYRLNKKYDGLMKSGRTSINNTNQV